MGQGRVRRDSGLDADIVEKIRSPQDIPRMFYELDLATPKQLRYLRILRVPIPARLSKKDAQQMIKKGKGCSNI